MTRPLPKVRFDCPVCGAALNAPQRTGGRTLPCPACLQFIIIPKVPGLKPSDHGIQPTWNLKVARDVVES
ncbi:MAG: hypothetical protein ACJ8F7_20645 [Gemmataceae bacterium]